MALGGKEGVDHPAADQQRVGLGEQVGDDAELVRDLRATQDDHVGPLGLVGRLPQRLDLVEHQEAGRVRQAKRHVVDRRLLAVHHAETVGDERVGQRGELVGQRAALGLVLGGLTCVEADVLQQRDLAVGQARDGRLGGLAHDVGRQCHGPAEQLAQPRGDRRQGVLRVRLALRAAQVRGDDNAGAGVEQAGQGRQRGADAPVVGDGGAVQRHVEVGADEHALAAQVAQVVDGLHLVPRSDGWTRADMTTSACPGNEVAGLADVGHEQVLGTVEALAHVHGQVDQAVRVAPLVVVPGDDLDLVADHLGQARVEDALVRVRRRCRSTRSGRRRTRGRP